MRASSFSLNIIFTWCEKSRIKFEMVIPCVCNDGSSRVIFGAGRRIPKNNSRTIRRAAPIFFNGDVFTPKDFKEKLEFSGADYILIARGAIGNPYIFKQIQDYMETGKYNHKNPLEQFEEYLILAKKHKIEFNQIKSQAIYFTKGTPKGAKLRELLVKTKTLEELLDKIEDFKNV